MLGIEKKTLLKVHSPHRLEFALFMPSSELLFCSCRFPCFFQGSSILVSSGPRPQAPSSMAHRAAFFLPHEVRCSVGLPTVQCQLGDSPIQTLSPTLQGPSSLRSLLQAAEAQSWPASALHRAPPPSFWVLLTPACFLIPRDGSWFLLLIPLRYLRVSSLPFQSANTGLINSLY